MKFVDKLRAVFSILAGTTPEPETPTNVVSLPQHNDTPGARSASFTLGYRAGAYILTGSHREYLDIKQDCEMMINADRFNSESFQEGHMAAKGFHYDFDEVNGDTFDIVRMTIRRTEERYHRALQDHMNKPPGLDKK